MQEALDAHRHFRSSSAITPSSPTRSIRDASSIFYEWSERIARCMRAAVVDKHENPSSRMKLDSEIVAVQKSSVVPIGIDTSRELLFDSQRCRVDIRNIRDTQLDVVRRSARACFFNSLLRLTNFHVALTTHNRHIFPLAEPPSNENPHSPVAAPNESCGHD